MTKTTTAAVYVKRVLAFAVCLLWGLALKAETPNSDDINDVILVEGSVPVKWTNDATYPWELTETEIVTPLISENDKTCTLTGTYTSAYPTEIKFDWYRRRYSDPEKIELYIDDVLYRTITTYYTSSNPWYAVTPVIIPAGTHVIRFVNYSGNNASNSVKNGYRGAIRNVRVWQCKELEKSVLTSQSMPITFKNDSTNLWITENGYISSNGSKLGDGSTSTISTTFTIDKLSKFSLQATIQSTSTSSSRDNALYVVVDGKRYASKAGSGWFTISVVLEPGEHTIEFQALHNKNYEWAEIKDVELHQKWINATLASAGDLGREILYGLDQYGYDDIRETELLKISGPMNADDWAILKNQLTIIKCVDLTDAKIEEIPASAFNGLGLLSSVLLPEGLKRIGNYAFQDTWPYKYHIPASVEYIGTGVWQNTALHEITFAENSQLKEIGVRAFYGCTNLEEFVMPDSVEKLNYVTNDTEFRYNDGNYVYYAGGGQFSKCTRLKRLHLSDGITFLPGSIASGCSALSEVNLPIKLDEIGYYAFSSCSNLNSIIFPNSLTGIGRGGFGSCSKLTAIELPDSLTYIGAYAFGGCSNLKVVDIPESVTSVGEGAFHTSGVENVTLNSHCNSFYVKSTSYYTGSGVFKNCYSLKTVVCPVATPPSYSGPAPFEGVTAGNVKLIVPDFAVEDYKLDSYWNKFIVEAGDDASVRDYWYIGNGLTLDKGKRIRNTPEVVMATGSSIWIDGEGAQPFSKFTYGNEEGYPTSFFSQTDAVTATELVNRFWIDSAEKWFFFSPVTDVDFADIYNTTTDSWVIRRYNGQRRASQNTSSGNWQNVTEGKLLRGEGYIVRANETGWLVMPVAKENHQQFFGAAEATLPINAYACEDQPANANWNFMGNPYPTCFDIHDMDMEAPITVWTGSTYKALSLSDDRYVLRPMQPFFVQKPEECESLAMLRDGKQLTTTPSNKKVRRRAPETGRDLINLSIRMEADTVEADMTRVVVNERATAGYDAARDASKFMSLDLATAQIYTFDNAGQQMAINERPYGEGSVRLGVYLPKRGAQYVISADRADRDAYIYDSVTGLEHSFEYGPYTFTADTEGLCNDRFILGFAPGQSTGAGGLGEDEVKVIAGRGAIEVAAPAGTEVAVYGADGLKAASFTASEGRMTVPVQAGVYVVTVAGESRTVIVK